MNHSSLENTISDHKANFSASEIAHFNQHAHQWWDEDGAYGVLHEINPTRLAWIQRYSPSLDGKKILDCGCGGGILSEAMAKLGAQVTGIDLAQDLLEVAHIHARMQQLNIHYQQADIVELAKDSSFAQRYDVLTCMEMLEHVPCPQAIVSACAELLKKDGVAFFSTIHRHPMAYIKAIMMAEYVLSLVPKHTHFYEHLIKPSELIAWCEQAGLRVLAISGMDFSPFKPKGRRSKLVDDVRVNYLLACQKM